MARRAMTVLNEQGDQTIVWDESSDAFWLEVIRKKMAEGVIFFIVEPRFAGLLPSERTPLKEPEDALKHRAVSIRDEDMAKLIAAGRGEVVRTPDAPAKTVRKAVEPDEIVKSESVAVKPMKGG